MAGERMEAGLGRRVMDSVIQQAVTSQQLAEKAEQERLQAALQPVLAGQPQAGDALQMVQRAHAQRLNQLARAALLEAVQAGQQDLQDGRTRNAQELQVAVQEGQVRLQDRAAGP